MLPPGTWLLLATAAMSGCSPAHKEEWRGYSYDDLLAKSPARMSPAYPSARACLTALVEATRTAPRTAGFACATACPAADSGYVSDCGKVER